MDPPSQRGAVFLFPDPYKPGGMAVGSGCRPMESGSYQEFLKNPLNHPIYTHLPEPLRHLRAAREYEQPAMQKTPQMLPSNFYPGFFPTYPMQPQLQSPEQLQLFWAHVSHQFQHQFHPYVAQQQAVYQAALQPQPASVSYVSPVPVVEQQQVAAFRQPECQAFPSSFHQTTPATSQASEDDWSKASCSGEEPLPDMPRLDKSIQPPSDVEDEDDFDGPPILTPPPELDRADDVDEHEPPAPALDLPRPKAIKPDASYQALLVAPPPQNNLTPPETPEDEAEDDQMPDLPDLLESEVPSVEQLPEVVEVDKEIEKENQQQIELQKAEPVLEKVEKLENIFVEPKQPELVVLKRVQPREAEETGKRRRLDDELTGCKWADCGYQGRGMNKLYDHVIQEHIIPLSAHNTSMTPTTCCMSREGSVASFHSEGPPLNLAKELLSRGSKRTRRGAVREEPIDSRTASDSDENDPYGCQWADCSMRLTRGDGDRKYEWLREHFRTRHAKGAATYKCIVDGCRGRFVTNRQLEDHVRTGHIQAAANRKERKPGDIYRRMVKDLPPVYSMPSQPYLGSYQHSRFVALNRKVIAAGPGARIGFVSKKTGSGATWRKRRIDASIRCATIVIPKTLMLKETSSNTANIEDTDFSAKPSKQELRAALVKIQEASQRLLPPTTLSALFPAPSH